MKGTYDCGFVFNRSKCFRSVKCKIITLLIVLYRMSHHSWVNKLTGSWLDDLTSGPGRVQLCSVWHLTVGHLTRAVGTRHNAARPFYGASVIIYCWNVSCMEFASMSLRDFMAWHLGTKKTFPFLLLEPVLKTGMLVHQCFCGIFLLCTSPRKSWWFTHHPL